MPAAVITLAFDPGVEVGGLVIRLETIGIALAILIALVLAALVADRRRESDHASGDLIFLVLGIIPGAIVGGRLGYLLLHLDYYTAVPSTIVDPAQGSLELGLAVVGGTLTGSLVSGLLGGPIGRWLGIATAPVLLALALGKLAMATGGSGQGAPTDVAWATAYLGEGPWGSLAPATPSHPSQVYEALATFVVLGVVVVLGRILGPRAAASRDGRLFFIAIGLWGLARAAVASTWRDPPAVGPLSAVQVIAIGIAIVAGLAVVAIVVRARRGYRVDRDVNETGPAGAPSASGPEGEVGS